MSGRFTARSRYGLIGSDMAPNLRNYRYNNLISINIPIIIIYKVVHISGTPVASATILSNFSQLLQFFTQAIYCQFAITPPNLKDFYQLSPKICLF